MRPAVLFLLFPVVGYSLDLGLSFPPVADSTQRAFTSEHLGQLTVDRIRFAEDWTLREPNPGEFNWGPLDSRLSWAETESLSVLLTIQSKGPPWACGLSNNQGCVYAEEEDFRNYIRALLRRYSNQIEKIQFGNEWNTTFSYIGSASDYVRFNNILYEEVQIESPSTEVVLGGLSTGAMTILSGCTGRLEEVCDDGVILDRQAIEGYCADNYAEFIDRVRTVLNQAQYDLLDIHLYDDAENWPDHLAAFRAIAPDKPILVSEFGGPNIFCEPSDPEYQAERLAVYLSALCELEGIEEAYFFKLVERGDGSAHEKSGLIDGDLTLKPAYEVFKNRNSFCPGGPDVKSAWTLR